MGSRFPHRVSGDSSSHRLGVPWGRYLGCLHLASRLGAAPFAPQPQVTGIACSVPRTFAWGASGVRENRPRPPSGTDLARSFISAQPRFALFVLGTWAPLTCGRRGRLCGAGTQPGNHREEKASRFLEETERRSGRSCGRPGSASPRDGAHLCGGGARPPLLHPGPRRDGCGRVGPELRGLGCIGLPGLLGRGESGVPVL